MGKIKIDITGQRFGRWTVLEETKPVGYERRWLCKCDCGTQKVVYMSNLRKGLTTSCGCLRSDKASEAKSIDLVGKKFNRLTVLAKTKKRTNATEWQCLCECGRTTVVNSSSLIRGSTKSCGCYRKDTLAPKMSNINKSSHTKDDVFVPSLTKKRAKNNTTGVKGVFEVKRKNGVKYQAQIGIGGRRIFLGIYDTVEEAAEARRLGEEKYHAPYLNNGEK